MVTTDALLQAFSLELNHRLHPLYLAAFLLVALAIYFLRRERTPKTLAGALRFVFPKELIASRSSCLDLQCFLFGRLMSLWITWFSVLGSSVFATMIWFNVLYTVFGPIEPFETHLLGEILYTFCMVIAFDLGFFIAHWLMHRVPILWEFHKVHHSATVLTPLTNFRVHPVEKVVWGTLILPLSGIAGGTYIFLFAPTNFDFGESLLTLGSATQLTILQVNTVLFVFHLVSNLRHSHIWLSYGPWVSRFLVSPAMHQIHHSKASEHQGKNLGFMFSCWDALARRRYIPLERPSLSFGLPQRIPAFQSLGDLYLAPLRSSYILARKALRSWFGIVISYCGQDRTVGPPERSSCGGD